MTAEPSSQQNDTTILQDGAATEEGYLSQRLRAEWLMFARIQPSLSLLVISQHRPYGAPVKGTELLGFGSVVPDSPLLHSFRHSNGTP